MKKNRIFSLLFGIAILALFAILVRDIHQVWTLAPGDETPGWDVRSVCAGTDAFQKGLNPYYVKNLEGTHLSYTYPPLTFDLFRPLCDSPLYLRSSFEYLYPLLALLVTLLLSGRDLAQRRFDRAGVKGLFVLGGFAGFHWSYRTGNIAIFEGFLLAIALCSYYPTDRTTKLSPKHFLGAVALGFDFFLKLINFPALLALYFLPFERPKKLKLIAVGFVAYLIPMTISILGYPGFFSTYLQAVSGKIPGQHSPATEGAAGGNGSLFFVAGHFLNIGRKLGLSVDAHYAALQSVGYVLMILLLAVIFVKRVVKLLPRPQNSFSILGWLDQLDGFLLKNPRAAFYLTTLALLEMLLSLPRVKPYAYFSLATLAAMLVTELPPTAMITSAFFALILPLLSWSGRVFGGYEQTVGVLVVWGLGLYFLKRLEDEKPA